MPARATYAPVWGPASVSVWLFFLSWLIIGVASIPTKAIYFDQTNGTSRLICTTPPQLNFEPSLTPSSAGFTVQWWAMPMFWSNASLYTIMLDHCMAQYISWSTEMLVGGGMWFTVEPVFHGTAPNTIPYGVWTHVSVVFYPWSRTLIYYNGTLLATSEAPFSTAWICPGYPIFQLGGAQGESILNHFTGALAEVRIWNYTLTPDEISSTWNVDVPRNASGLQTRMDFSAGISPFNDTTSGDYSFGCAPFGPGVSTTAFPSSLIKPYVPPCPNTAWSDAVRSSLLEDTNTTLSLLNTTKSATGRSTYVIQSLPSQGNLSYTSNVTFCGPLSTPLHGWLRWSSAVPNGVELACDPGYSPTSNLTAVCRLDGTWGPLGNCTALPSCATSTSFSVSFRETTPADAAAYFTCPPGTKRMDNGRAPATIRCSEYSNPLLRYNPPGGVCVTLVCPQVALPANVFSLAYSNSQYIGSVLTYNCSNGLNSSYTAPRVCQEDGTWNWLPVTCVNRGCPDFCLNCTLGVCTQCQYGTGPSCSLAGVTCPSLGVDSTATYVCTGNHFNDNCTLQCAAGYQRASNSVKLRTCRENGTWDGNFTSCVPMYCYVPPTPPHGRWQGLTLSLGSFTLICDAGYSVFGLQPVCNGSGVWATPLPFCKMDTFPPPITVNSAVPPVLIYSALPNMYGPDGFLVTGVTACGNNTIISNISVAAINDAPSFVLVNPNIVIPNVAGGTHTFAFATGDPGPFEAQQAISYTVQLVNTTNPSLFSSSPVVAPNGVIAFAVTTGREGAATFMIWVADDGGTQFGGVNISAAQYFTIVTSRTLSDMDLPMTEHTELGITLSGASLDFPTYRVVTLPAAGVLLQYDGTPITAANTLVADSAGRLWFNASYQQGGIDYASFTYIVDNDPYCPTSSTVTIDVTLLNDPFCVDPVPAQLLTVPGLVLLTVNASDPDTPRLNFTIVELPRYLNVTINNANLLAGGRVIPDHGYGGTPALYWCSVTLQIDVVPGNFTDSMALVISDGHPRTTSVNFTVNMPCPSPSRMTSAFCVPCDMGSFNPQLDDAASECLPCPAGTYWLPDSEAPCVACPVGGSCGGGAMAPVAVPGYFGQAPVFSACLPAAACLGANQCAEGNQGDLCASCTPGYYNDKGLCPKCPSLAWLFIVILVLLIIIVCALLIKVARMSTAYFTSIAVGFNFLQLVALLASFDLDWPPFVISVMKSFNVFSLRLDLFSPQCAFNGGDIPFVILWAGQLSLPLVFLFMFSVANLFATMYFYVRPRLDKYKDRKYTSRFKANLKRFVFYVFSPFTYHHLLLFRRVSINAYATVSSLLYLVVVQACLSIFVCDTQDNGVSTLTADPRVVCFTSQEWITYRNAAIGVLVVFGGGFPFAVGGFLYWYRERLLQDETIAKMGLLYRRYANRFPFWELCIVIRKLIIVIGMTIIRSSIGEAILCLVVVLLSALIQYKVQPYRTRRVNRLENITLMCAAACISIGVLFKLTSQLMSLGVRTAFGVIVIIVVAVCTVIIIYVVVQELRQQYNLIKHGVQGGFASDELSVGELFFEAGIFLTALRRDICGHGNAFQVIMTSKEKIELVGNLIKEPVGLFTTDEIFAIAKNQTPENKRAVRVQSLGGRFHVVDLLFPTSERFLLRLYKIDRGHEMSLFKLSCNSLVAGTCFEYCDISSELNLAHPGIVMQPQVLDLVVGQPYDFSVRIPSCNGARLGRPGVTPNANPQQEPDPFDMNEYKAFSYWEDTQTWEGRGVAPVAEGELMVWAAFTTELRRQHSASSLAAVKSYDDDLGAFPTLTEAGGALQKSTIKWIPVVRYVVHLTGGTHPRLDVGLESTVNPVFGSNMRDRFSSFSELPAPTANTLAVTPIPTGNAATPSSSLTSVSPLSSSAPPLPALPRTASQGNLLQRTPSQSNLLPRTPSQGNLLPRTPSQTNLASTRVSDPEKPLLTAMPEPATNTAATLPLPMRRTAPSSSSSASRPLPPPPATQSPLIVDDLGVVPPPPPPPAATTVPELDAEPGVPAEATDGVQMTSVQH